jgi:hypothetical protein
VKLLADVYERPCKHNAKQSGQENNASINCNTCLLIIPMLFSDYVGGLSKDNTFAVDGIDFSLTTKRNE